VKTSQKGIDLIKQFEGFRSKAYQDVVGVWTIGYGFTDGVKPGDTMTRVEAEIRLVRELEPYEQAVLAACTLPPNQHQFDALVCCAWNIGIAGIRKSSMIRAHNRGDFQAAARAFSLWNKAGGKVWPGLTRRRAAEAALYLTPVEMPKPDPAVNLMAEEDTPQLEPMPQAVDPERPMTQSSIVRASTVAGGTAALAGVAETVNTVSSIKYGLNSLGSWMVPLLLLVTVAAVGWAIYERLKQRREGWA
jgi:lysozyme